jgi:hypothetical protein
VGASQRYKARLLAVVIRGERGGAGDLALALTGGWQAMESAGDGEEQSTVMNLVDNLLGARRNNMGRVKWCGEGRGGGWGGARRLL